MDDAAATTILGFSPTELAIKVATLAVAALIAYAVQRVLARGTRRALELAGVPSASIFVNLLRALVWAIALLSVLQPVFGVDPTWLVTTLGVVSVAISLGMQDTVSNIVSGFGLMLGHVIAPGDWVQVGSIVGCVTDVNLRSTTLKQRNGDVEVIPNSVLNKTSLTHLDPWNATVCEVSFEVAPGADLDAVEAEVLELVRRATEGIADPRFEPDVVFWDRTSYGVQGHARAHIKDGVSVGVFRDRMARALQGRPWLADSLTSS